MKKNATFTNVFLRACVVLGVSLLFSIPSYAQKVKPSKTTTTPTLSKEESKAQIIQKWRTGKTTAGNASGANSAIAGNTAVPNSANEVADFQEVSKLNKDLHGAYNRIDAQLIINEAKKRAPHYPVRADLKKFSSIEKMFSDWKTKYPEEFKQYTNHLAQYVR